MKPSDPTRDELIEFYTDMRDNARRIAESKHGVDKAGWLEDARFHDAALKVLARVAALPMNEQEPTGD